MTERRWDVSSAGGEWSWAQALVRLYDHARNLAGWGTRVAHSGVQLILLYPRL
jgi:hypothetical protein